MGLKRFLGYNPSCQIFTKKPSFYWEFHVKKDCTIFIENLVPQGGWALVKRFGARAQNYFLGITWQPLARFSQITPHFVQNLMTNTLPVFLFIILVPHGLWGLAVRQTTQKDISPLFYVLICRSTYRISQKCKIDTLFHASNQFFLNWLFSWEFGKKNMFTKLERRVKQRNSLIKKNFHRLKLELYRF